MTANSKAKATKKSSAKTKTKKKISTKKKTRSKVKAKSENPLQSKATHAAASKSSSLSQKTQASSQSDLKGEKTKGVARAVQSRAEIEAKRKKISEFQKTMEDQLNREKSMKQVKSTSLVKEDCSPVNRSRDELIVEFAPLIKYIAQRIAARLPANIELDDLVSSGVIGLMDAIDKYDMTRDNKFKTYAEFRIRGAILDELRSQDWVPRSVREKAKQLERVYSKIEQEKGRQATDEEVCEALQISQGEYHEMLNQVRSVSILSFDDLSSFSKADKKSLHSLGDGSPKVSTPFTEVNLASLKRMIAEAIKDLPEKQRLVLSLYYYEDLNLKEIGRVLDVTESRVSQLHTQAVLRLKGKLRTHWDDFVALMG